MRSFIRLCAPLTLAVCLVAAPAVAQQDQRTPAMVPMAIPAQPARTIDLKTGGIAMLALIEAEMRVAMALTGCTRVAEIDRNRLFVEP